MSTTLTFNNTSFPGIPNTAGESGWETTLTTYLAALASGAAVNSVVRQTVRVVTSSPVTVQAATDYAVVCRLTVPGAVTVNLPPGATGRLFAVVDGTGDAATNNITVTASGAETINGASTYVINENRGGVLFAWNGTGWNILADFVGNDPGFSSVRVSGVLRASGAQYVGVTGVKTANYSVGASDYLIPTSTAGGAFTLTLPNAATELGRLIVVKDQGGAWTSFALTVATAGGNIDGSSTVVLDSDFASFTFCSNGTNWTIL